MEKTKGLNQSKNSAEIVNVKTEPPGDKVCLFLRCSSDRQDYKRQLSELEDLSYRNGWEIDKVIATKISGMKTYNQRQDLQDLFDYIRKSKPSKIVVSELSRIGRNSKDIRRTIDFCHSNGVSIYFKNLGMESLQNGEETFVVNIVMAIYTELASEETRLLSQRIKSGQEQARRNGKIIGKRKGETMSKEKFLSKYKSVIKDLKSGLSLNKVCAIHKISKNTTIKVKRIAEIN